MTSENNFSESQEKTYSAEFAYRIFNTGHDKMLAVCDKSLVGKNFNEGDLQIHVSEEFYSEEECGEDEVIRILKSSTIVNAVGEKIIRLMVENGLIKEGYVIHIDGVPHAQIIAVE
jgi:hypothetical protein